MAQALLPPGFRFHPTDVELVSYYLKRKVMGKHFRFVAISEVEIYKFAPWELPDKSCLRSKDLEWYFFCPRDKKYPNGSRANRSTEIGYWKTTGKDRTILHDSRTVGMKKSLIFHTGKPPKGDRTNWVMYEYRLVDEQLVASGVAQDAFVLCKIFRKSGIGPKIGEQYGAPYNEEDWADDDMDFEATVAAFPFLPRQQPTPQLPNNSNTTTTIMEPAPLSAADTVFVEPAPLSAVVTTSAECSSMSIADTSATELALLSATDTSIAEPVQVELPFAVHSVATHSAATGSGLNEEPLTSVPLVTEGVTIFDSPEMDGIQLDSLMDLLSPYHQDNSFGQLPPQEPYYDCMNFNDAAEIGGGEIYGEIADLLGVMPNAGGELAGLDSSFQTQNYAVQPIQSELGAQHYLELNDLFPDQDDNFISDYLDPAPSPEMDVNAFFS